jgi:UDP-2-acetamido-2,6-beta-L-arabino-hexul-4-ose reductase
MNILITGSQGFIAKNLIAKLFEFRNYNILTLNRKSSKQDIYKKLIKADIIFHLAGVNKENPPKYSYDDNYIFTENICSILKNNFKKTKIVYASSMQVKLKNVYGESKLKAERILLNYKKNTGAEVLIYRLPNIFGKFCPRSPPVTVEHPPMKTPHESRVNPDPNGTVYGIFYSYLVFVIN